MHIRLPFCATISALLFVTVWPHERGGVLDDSLVRAAIGLVVGLLVGAAIEWWQLRAARRAAAAPPPENFREQQAQPPSRRP